jgi:glutathione peroxidase
MRTAIFSTAFVFLAACTGVVQAKEEGGDALDFQGETIEGKQVDLTSYRGKVVLVVNVASRCGLTPQYEQLQALYKQYEDKGFVVVGFPCNKFGKQEPGNAKQIAEFCTTNYGITFPMMAKIDVNGEDASPLYKHLTSLDAKPAGAGKISWNFEKFLIGRDGEVKARFSPRTKPDDKEVVTAIEAELEN